MIAATRCATVLLRSEAQAQEEAQEEEGGKKDGTMHWRRNMSWRIGIHADCVCEFG